MFSTMPLMWLVNRLMDMGILPRVAVVAIPSRRSKTLPSVVAFNVVLSSMLPLTRNPVMGSQP
ncbi:hypothetical protein Pla52n_19580 [Stieleria varia]|uniref:Uncharacterized protein n=1 Tax=Stieleria varia TaxID=2528005 RepID=A0A5C6B372_9BACT|nr:hypothetical protein Pla52n_19580 [Stieleria varia]